MLFSIQSTFGASEIKIRQVEGLILNFAGSRGTIDVAEVE